jgi:methionyl aminopeptidase
MAEAAKRKCRGVDCPNDAGTLQCPTCLKSGTDSFFCSQDCFKRSWVRGHSDVTGSYKIGALFYALLRGKPRADHLFQSEHKSIHKKSNILTNLFPPKVVSEPDPATGTFNPYPSFPYSGSLRPVYPLSAKRTIPKTIPHPDYARDGIPRSEQKLIGRHNITILNKEEQEGMRKVCRLAREVLDAAARELKPGVTTDYIDEVVHKACIERDVRGVPLWCTKPY